MDAETRLLLRTTMPGDGCWEWQGAVDSGGYGRVSVDGKQYRTHRLAWELFHGPIPEHDSYHGACICHRCDNRRCVRPDHLFIATQDVNMRDKARKGRARNQHLGAIA